MDEIYDIIVAGGGVASLNTIYELLKIKPKLKIVLFEKDDVLGGRIKKGYLGNQPVDLGAVRIPTDFTLTPNLVRELGLSLIPFTTALKGTFTREKWFPIDKLNESQERYFLPNTTPPEENQIELLFATLKELVGTLDYNELDPNKLVNGVRLVDWGIYDLLRIKLTEEQLSWISNSLNFSFYKTAWNAYEWCIHNFHDSEFYMVGTGEPNSPKFGNYISIIDKLDEKTPTVMKNKECLVKSAIYDHCKKIWEIKVKDLRVNKCKKYYSKRFISGIPIFNLKNVLINIPNEKLWSYLLNCAIPFPLSRVYIEYPNKWWSETKGSFFDESTNKMVWIMSDTSPVLLASYSDEFQSNFWEGIPESKLLEKAHEGVCRAFNVDINTVPVPIRFIQKVWTYPTYPAFLYKKGIIGSEIQAIATKPFEKMPFYIASESLSQRIGWVEGALYSSYSVVKKILSEY